ncbi:MAG: protein kinase domain-containing protein, partial [Polyangiales bacterium]
AAHETGIVHRDLKPENVFLVDRDGEDEFVKVVDFGLSTFVQSDDTRLTRAGQSVGTPLYMAPEQAGAHAFDARVDVYSLGVLIFEMTTGRLPFEAPTLQALLVALATQPPRSIRYYAPELPVELDDLVLRFIARDPRVRPKSAAAALAEIIALEERLSQKTAQNAASSSSGARVRVREVGIDGLPGPLQGPFADELSGHLDALRKTGRLTTVEESVDSGPVSSGQDQTRPMDRREINDLMAPDARVAMPERRPGADSSGKQAVAPRAAGRPARTGSGRPAPMPSSQTASSVERPSPRKLKPAPAEEEIEEDSGVFYGRIGKDGKPMVEIKNAEHRGDSATLPPAPTKRKRPAAGPPPIVLWIALAAFVVVAVLVAARALR